MRRFISVCAPLGACISFVCLAPARAEETVLQEVVVTASLNRNLLDVAQPTAILGGDDLTRQVTGSLGETLSRQLGVSSSYFGPTASRPVIRGLGGYRVQTLQDGLATLDVGGLSDDHATTVDPTLAQQLEVLKGPATLLYGSGASGGLVNVVTNRIPTKQPERAVDGVAEIRAGTVADERAGVASLTFGGELFALHGDAFGSESGAVKIPGSTVSDRLREQIEAGGGEVQSTSGSIPNAGSDTRGGSLGASWLGATTLAGASVSSYESTYGIPSEETAFIDMKQTRVDAKLEWHAESGWLRGVQLSGVYNDYGHTEFEAANQPGTEFKQDAFEVRAAANHVHSDTWRGTFGAQMTRLDFAAMGEEAFVPASITDSLGIFALEEFDVRPWSFNVGARYEAQRVDAASASGLPSFDDGALSFAAGAVFKATEEDTLAINVTRSARHPQATELYADGPHLAAQRFEVGDAALETEIATTIDATLRRNGETLSWLVGVFYNDYENFVFADPTGAVVDDLPEFQYRQSPAKLYGFELEFWVPLYDAGELTARLRLMSDYVHGEREGGAPLPQMPPLRVGAGVHVEFSSWHAEVEGVRSAEQDRVAVNELATDGYVMLNADVSYEMDSTYGKWFCFVRGTNLLDEDARQHTSALKDVVPLPGRGLSAGVRVSF